MKLKVLFDRAGIDERFQTGWGLSFLIGDKLLFDTGEKFGALAHNAGLMGVDLSGIATIALSHDHWDHVSGIDGLLARNKDITVYGCAGFNGEIKEKVLKGGGRYELTGKHHDLGGGLHLLGDNHVIYKGKGLIEQALFIQGEKNLTMICGCCHPGLVNLIHKAGIFFGHKVDTVVGGLHLIDKEQRFVKYILDEMGMFVEKVYPSHCTGHDACRMLQEKYRDNFCELKAGMEIEL